MDRSNRYNSLQEKRVNILSSRFFAKLTQTSETVRFLVAFLLGIFICHCQSFPRPSSPQAPYKVFLSKEILSGEQYLFQSHIDPQPYSTALAMTVNNKSIESLRLQIEKELAQPLQFFRGWDPKGEAHITVITPPEYELKLKPWITRRELDLMAQRFQIQQSDLKVIGLGHGKRILESRLEHTHFVIVYSENLLKLRRAISQLIKTRGAPISVWDPDHFYPHITVGFTRRDLHEADGVIKDAQNSLDKRFEVIIK